MIKYLFDNGYNTISTEEFYKWYIREVNYNKRTVLITIDDGFYEDYYLVYPIIKKYHFKATSFIVGSRIKNKTEPYNKFATNYIGIDAINKVRCEYPDYEFQSHSYDMHYIIANRTGHLSKKILTMSYKEIENDILQNKKFNFTTMAYPYGFYNEDIKKILKKFGYLIAFKFSPKTYATRNDDRFAISRIKLNGYATIETLKNWLKNV